MKLLEILNEIEVRNIRPYIITVPIIGKIAGEVVGSEKVLVYPEDLKQKMSWYKATEACEELGDGWRLPTKEELKAMYEQLHKQGKGNFKKDWYWSSSNSKSFAWHLDFSNGSADDEVKNYIGQVRPVRDI